MTLEGHRQVVNIFRVTRVDDINIGGESCRPVGEATDMVKVHYRGTLIDGTEFDSSYKRNQPATFPLNGVIRCWTEGVQLMKVGGKATLVCPSDIAYGTVGVPAYLEARP